MKDNSTRKQKQCHNPKLQLSFPGHISPAGRGGSFLEGVRALSLGPAPAPGASPLALPWAKGDTAQKHSRHSSPAPLMVNAPRI